MAQHLVLRNRAGFPTVQSPHAASSHEGTPRQVCEPAKSPGTPLKSQVCASVTAVLAAQSHLLAGSWSQQAPRLLTMLSALSAFAHAAQALARAVLNAASATTTHASPCVQKVNEKSFKALQAYMDALRSDGARSAELHHLEFHVWCPRNAAAGNGESNAAATPDAAWDEGAGARYRRDPRYWHPDTAAPAARAEAPAAYAQSSAPGTQPAARADGTDAAAAARGMAQAPAGVPPDLLLHGCNGACTVCTGLPNRAGFCTPYIDSVLHAGAERTSNGQADGASEAPADEGRGEELELRVVSVRLPPPSPGSAQRLPRAVRMSLGRLFSAVGVPNLFAADEDCLVRNHNGGSHAAQ